MQIGLVKKQGLILCTQLDNIEDLNKIRYVLKNKYNLDSRIINHEEKPRICIGGESFTLLKSIIISHMYPSMLDMLHNDLADTAHP
jgi:hypothetical protein